MYCSISFTTFSYSSGSLMNLGMLGIFHSFISCSTLAARVFSVFSFQSLNTDLFFLNTSSVVTVPIDLTWTGTSSDLNGAIVVWEKYWTSVAGLQRWHYNSLAGKVYDVSSSPRVSRCCPVPTVCGVPDLPGVLLLPAGVFYNTELVKWLLPLGGSKRTMK